MSDLFDPELESQLDKSGVIAVLVIDRPADAVPCARALLDGGIGVMELAMRTDASLEALSLIHNEVPEMIAGVGTVLSPEQLDAARQAGAAFGVAPGFNAAVVSHAAARSFSFAPGIVTPSDIERAISAGCRLLKFFPAEPSGGLPYLESIAAPYAHLGLRFIPLGGVNVQNAGHYLASPLICAVGGSWLAPRSLIQQQAWPRITEKARVAHQVAAAARHAAK